MSQVYSSYVYSSSNSFAILTTVNQWYARGPQFTIEMPVRKRHPTACFLGERIKLVWGSTGRGDPGGWAVAKDGMGGLGGGKPCGGGLAVGWPSGLAAKRTRFLEQVFVGDSV